MTMPENFPELTEARVLSDSEELLGTSRIDPMSSFCTDIYLQRTFDNFRSNPGALVCSDSNLHGGNEIFKSRRLGHESRLSQIEDPDAAPKASGYDAFFRIGYGLVEHTVAASHFISQAEDEAVSPDAYNEWLQKPIEDRTEELHNFLESQDAELLAQNFLDPEQDGSMLNFTMALRKIIKRPNFETYSISASYDPVAREEILEGSLAALFLLREHYIAQARSDLDIELHELPELPASEGPSENQ